MVNVFISVSLQNIKGCLKGNLDSLATRLGSRITFVEEVEIATVVLSEPNSVHLFPNMKVVALTDNEQLIIEHENVVDTQSFPTSYNDLPAIINSLVLYGSV